jgi:hypothetical protein
MKQLFMTTVLTALMGAGLVACQGPKDPTIRAKKPLPPLPASDTNASLQPWNRPTKASEMGGPALGMPTSR